MDGCGQMQPRMGTPTNVMHIQQGTIESPSVCSAPMTPQQMHTAAARHDARTSNISRTVDQSGGFTPQQLQMPQGYPQGVPESPGAIQMQQQMMVTGASGQGDGSPGMYVRQQQIAAAAATNDGAATGP
ncbi:hypothetical protein OSTOST_16972 [Ostertagia ostertagi]